MKKIYIIILLFVVGSLPVFAAGSSGAYNNQTLTIANSTGCAVTSYTFTQTTIDGKAYRHQNGVSTATITFPAGIDASTFTSGTCNGAAITTFTANVSTFTFTFPSNVGRNATFSIVLNGITNGDNISGNATITADNTSGGQNTGTYAVTTTACPTCSDGIKNQGETGIDCGGPCTACMTCSDGIQNQGETGVDCGGPCSPCPTCSDGIQNQGEQGIDCGGPCASCGVVSNLYNVVINNNGPGVNFLSDMITHQSGTVTLTQGVFGTNAFEVYTLNKVTGAITVGHVGSYVEGNLRRKLNPTGSYNFPVGNATKGYELANINFTSTTEIRNLLARFDDWAPLAAPLNESECGITYDGDPLDNGYWTISADTLDTTGVYTATLYNRGYTNWIGTDSLTIMRDGGSGYTLRNGICSLNFPDTVIRAGMYGFSEFATAQGLTGVLPVNMLSFNGKNRGTHNYLYWETGKEERNGHFELERSRYGINWNRIGIIEATNSINGSFYDFIDNYTESGINYYRLKQVDEDGSFQYTRVIKLKTERMGSSPVVYPNPSKGDVILNYTVSVSDFQPSLQIINSIGQVVYQSELDNAEGSHNHRVNLTQFGSDIYYFKVILDRELYTEKVIISK